MNRSLATRTSRFPRIPPGAIAMLVALLVALLFPVPAGAQVAGRYDPDPDAPETTTEVTVESGPDGVTIHITVEDLTGGEPGTDGTDGSVVEPDLPACGASPVNIGSTSTTWLQQGLEEHPGTLPWGVTCDDGAFGIAWVPVDGGVPTVSVGTEPIPPIDPAVVRAEVFRIVGLPAIGVGTNPTVGLVALPSWFWVGGYDGRTLRGSASLGRSTVDAEITPTGYRWSFGDGKVLYTHLVGRPYPAESNIDHTYERSSLRAGGTYTVRLTITWSARYRENGGGWLELDPISRSYTRAYPVQQLQSVLTSNR